jgi:hypothetical protein
MFGVEYWGTKLCDHIFLRMTKGSSVFKFSAKLLPILLEVDLHRRQNMWLQQDGALPLNYTRLLFMGNGKRACVPNTHEQ